MGCGKLFCSVKAHRKTSNIPVNVWSVIFKEAEPTSVEHYVKSMHFLTEFSCIRTEYGYFWSKYPYSVRMLENTDQKNS